jgi:hypothetical protein
MDRAEMAKTIFEALDKGASGNMLEPSRKGRTITKINEDKAKIKTLSDEKLGQIYERATEYLTTNNQPMKGARTTKYTKRNAPNTPTDTPIEGGNIIERITALEAKNAMLEQEVAELKRKLTEKEYTPKAPKAYTKSTTKILGWNISKQAKTSGGYRYEKWYATRTIEGKQRHIYLGDSAELAEQKVRSYSERNGIAI